MNPLLELVDHGQSYWLDNLTRDALRDGVLARRVRREGLRGVTSNQKTFSDAVLKSSAYDEDIARLAREGLSAEQIYQTLAAEDVREACDVLRPVYDSSDGRDGFVSLEVSPRFAHDTAKSVVEARSIVERVGRPNLMVKIPGTKAGIAAVEELLFQGVNVNVTLLFSVPRYAEFAKAYLRALERRHASGHSLNDVHSVASFFLSRIDVVVDELLAQRASRRGNGENPLDLAGKVAVANAKLAYQHFQKAEDDLRMAALRRLGAQPQRLLWASTGTKDPKYPDLMYVEPLIGPHTVTTMPEKTIQAFADHGVVADTLVQGVEEARETMESIARIDIDFDCDAPQLENEGIKKFLEPEAETLKHFDERCRKVRG